MTVSKNGRSIIEKIPRNRILTETDAPYNDKADIKKDESAAAHISAGSHVNAICIGEQKFGDKWLPYRPEIKKDDDKNPIIIRANTLKCSFCAMRNFRRSKECEKCYKENGVVKCVFDVRTEQVVESIERMLKEKSVFI